MIVAAAMAFTVMPAEIRAETSAEAAQEQETWAPISQYVQDKNYNVPSDYMAEKTGVNYGTVEDIQYQSTATNSKRKAKVILPAGYSTEKKYPVLYRQCHCIRRQ